MLDKYGVLTIESEPQSGLTNGRRWFVENHEGDRVKTGEGDSGQQRARTLAATLHAVDGGTFDLLPPGMLLDDRPRGHPTESSENQWESWTAENHGVPARVAAAGKAPLAGYLKIVHRERDSWIGSIIGVSGETVSQYLSDLRAGRR
jgi:hypothetical protein